MADREACRVIIESAQGKSTLSDCYSHYPLRVIQQEDWRSYVSLALVGFGGGLVSGDHIKLNVFVGPNSKASMKTVGSTKVFKSVNDKDSIQEIHGKLSENSLFISIPDPTSCYENSCFKQFQSYELAKNASLILVDWFTSGRENRDMFWGAKRIVNRLSVKIDNDYVILENQDNFHTQFGDLLTKFGKKKVVGTLIIIGPKTIEIQSQLQSLNKRQSFYEHREELNKAREEGSRVLEQPLIAISQLPNQTTMVRFMVDSVEYGYELLREILMPIADELDGFIPYSDRIHHQDQSVKSNIQCPIEALRKFKQSMVIE